MKHFTDMCYTQIGSTSRTFIEEVKSSNILPPILHKQTGNVLHGTEFIWHSFSKFTYTRIIRFQINSHSSDNSICKLGIHMCCVLTNFQIHCVNNSSEFLTYLICFFFFVHFHSNSRHWHNGNHRIVNMTPQYALRSHHFHPMQNVNELVEFRAQKVISQNVNRFSVFGSLVNKLKYAIEETKFVLCVGGIKVWVCVNRMRASNITPAKLWREYICLLNSYSNQDNIDFWHLQEHVYVIRNLSRKSLDAISMTLVRTRFLHRA